MEVFVNIFTFILNWLLQISLIIAELRTCFRENFRTCTRMQISGADRRLIASHRFAVVNAFMYFRLRLVRITVLLDIMDVDSISLLVLLFTAVVSCRGIVARCLSHAAARGVTSGNTDPA